jgi:hypothetical protein
MDDARVSFVIGRCSINKTAFGIRFHLFENQWRADHIFHINKTTLDTFGQFTAEGVFAIDEAYQGCPYCNSRSIWKCGYCGKICCWDGDTQIVTCAWCNKKGRLSGQITSLTVGDDL